MPRDMETVRRLQAKAKADALGVEPAPVEVPTPPTPQPAPAPVVTDSIALDELTDEVTETW